MIKLNKDFINFVFSHHMAIPIDVIVPVVCVLSKTYIMYIYFLTVIFCPFSLLLFSILQFQELHKNQYLNWQKNI